MEEPTKKILNEFDEIMTILPQRLRKQFWTLLLNYQSLCQVINQFGLNDVVYEKFKLALEEYKNAD